jgi:hypothetical protein
MQSTRRIAVRDYHTYRAAPVFIPEEALHEKYLE